MSIGVVFTWGVGSLMECVKNTIKYLQGSVTIFRSGPCKLSLILLVAMQRVGMADSSEVRFSGWR